MALDFPANPTNGQAYMGYVYSTAVGAWQAKPSAQSPFYTSDTPPANPVTGDSWFNTNDGTMYIYVYDGNTYQWVEHRSQIAKSQVGLVPIVPTSVAVNSGTGSVAADGTVTFSGVYTVSLNGCFTSAYTNYRIILMQESANSVTSDILFRYRKSGTDNTSSINYYYNGVGVDGSTVVSYQQAPQTYGYFYVQNIHGSVASNAHASSLIELQKPYLTKGKTYSSTAFGWTGSALFQRNTGGFNNDNVNSFDGFTIIAGNGGTTYGGTLKVYGYN